MLALASQAFNLPITSAVPPRPPPHRRLLALSFSSLSPLLYDTGVRYILVYRKPTLNNRRMNCTPGYACVTTYGDQRVGKRGSAERKTATRRQRKIASCATSTRGADWDVRDSASCKQTRAAFSCLRLGGGSFGFMLVLLLAVKGRILFLIVVGEI